MDKQIKRIVFTGLIFLALASSETTIRYMIAGLKSVPSNALGHHATLKINTETVIETWLEAERLAVRDKVAKANIQIEKIDLFDRTIRIFLAEPHLIPSIIRVLSETVWLASQSNYDRLIRGLPKQELFVAHVENQVVILRPSRTAVQSQLQYARSLLETELVKVLHSAGLTAKVYPIAHDKLYIHLDTQKKNLDLESMLFNPIHGGIYDTETIIETNGRVEKEDYQYPHTYLRNGKRWKVKLPAIIDAKQILSATSKFDRHTNQPIVLLRLNENGERLLARHTSENIGRHIALIINEKLILAAKIRQTIETGTLQISRGVTIEDGVRINQQIRNTSIAQQYKILETRYVSDE